MRITSLIIALCATAPCAAQFRTHVIDAEGTNSACAVIDIDRDGDLDVIAGESWYEAPSWKRHFAREVERIRGRFDDYSNLQIDVNRDGRVDLVSANYRSATIYWVEQPPDPHATWTKHLVASPGPMETAMRVDVDGDGRLDVLPNGVRFAAWWELAAPKAGDKRGAGPRWIRHDLPIEVAGHGVGFGDIDGDGRGDIVGPRGWLEAPEDRREGQWIWHPEFELTRASIPTLVFDVDEDGDNDIVWARGHRFGIYWLEQRGSSTTGAREWREHAIDTEVPQYHTLRRADLDGDGRAELIAGRRYMAHDGRDRGEHDPLAVYSYDFDATRRVWKRTTISWGGIAGFGLDPKVVDFDADGDLDIVASGRSGLVWFENRRLGAGAPSAKSVLPRLRDDLPDYENHSRLLDLRDHDGGMRPVKTLADWFLRRTDIVIGAQRAMGRLPGPEARCALDIETIETVNEPTHVRRRISFRSEPGDRVPAYLLVPKKLEGRAPAMLCLHQTTRIGKGEPAGLGGRKTLHYARELVERGYVCLVPDYPSFGDYEFDFESARDRWQSGTMKAIWNNIRAIDLLESMREVDRERIGCIGHSLGGHNAIFTAVFDRRVRAVVSSCGFTAFHRYYGGKLAGWTSARYMPRIRDAYGSDPDRVPFDFHELVAALAPRAFFANAPLHDDNFDVGGVREVMSRAAKVYELLGAKNELEAVYPDTTHDFPDDVRERAYEWLDARLRS